MCEIEAILESLEPLFERAEKEGLVFFNYRARYWTPLELREQHKKGRLVWGPVSWKLVSPEKRTASLNSDIKAAIAKRDEWLAKLERQQSA